MKKCVWLIVPFLCMLLSVSGCDKTERNFAQDGSPEEIQRKPVTSDVSFHGSDEGGEEEWSIAYTTFLNNLFEKKSSKTTFQFLIKDLDDNGIPELIIQKNGVNITVYTFHSEVIKVGHHDFKSGTTRFLYSDQSSYPGIFTFGVGGGCEWYGYISIQNDKMQIEKLWNKDFSGISKLLGKKRDKIEETSSDKQLIKESKRAYKGNQDLPFQKLHPKNFSPAKEVYTD